MNGATGIDGLISATERALAQASTVATAQAH